MRIGPRHFKMATVGVVLLASFSWNQEIIQKISEEIVFTDNGGWSWFNSEGIIVHDEKIIVSSVANSAGPGGQSLAKHVRVSTYNLNSKSSETVTVGIAPGPHGGDDHDQGALLSLQDGRYLCVFAGHNYDNNMFWAFSDSGNSAVWSNPQSLDVGGENTYSNVFHLAAENNGNGRIYNFHRGRGWNPNAFVSDNEGQSWKYGGRLVVHYGRPYVRYASNNKDVIHFITTEHHPRDFNNSVYHGYLKGGKTYNSFGDVIDNNFWDEDGPDPNAFTKIYSGNADNVAWTSDIHLDSNENPYITFTVQVGSAGLPTGQGGDDIRYHYARFDGERWHDNEIAYGGTRLYSGEDDYSGNIFLDPNNPFRVFISVDVNPETGELLVSEGDNQVHYEIFMGVSKDSGQTFSWTPLTENSRSDNIRPMSPIWDSTNTAVLWMRGRYTSYQNYNTQIVGVVITEEEEIIDLKASQLQDKNIQIISDSRKVAFKFERGEKGVLELYNILGQKVKRLNVINGQSRWDLGSKEINRAGVYFGQLKIPGEIYQQFKFVLNP